MNGLRTAVASCMLLMIGGAGCSVGQHPRAFTSLRENQIPWVGPDLRAKVTPLAKWDLVKGQHDYVRYSHGVRSVTNDQAYRAVRDYMEKWDQPLNASIAPGQHPVFIVAVLPTIGLIDKATVLEHPRLRTDTRPPFSDNLWWFNADWDAPPQPVIFDGDTADITTPWGRLHLDRSRGEVVARE